jgi:hypothetical protein
LVLPSMPNYLAELGFLGERGDAGRQRGESGCPCLNSVDRF